MTKKLALVAAGAFLLGTASGFLVGRSVPAHHYQQFGSVLVLDTATGKICTVNVQSTAVPLCPDVHRNPVDTALQQVQEQLREDKK
jgi:hypothetical protein